MDTDTLVWRKSSHSSGGDNCVEVAFTDTSVFVRNSKTPNAGTAEFTHGEWAAFTGGVAEGELTL